MDSHDKDPEYSNSVSAKYLQKNADKENRNPFILAVKGGDLHGVSHYLENGYKITAEAFMWAAWEGHIDILQFFINKLRYPDLLTILHTQNPQGSTALMMALYKGHIAAAKILIPLYNRDGLNLQGPEGNTALMFAARLKNNAKIVDALLAAQADVTLVNQQGSTAVNYAKQNPDIKSKTAFTLSKALAIQTNQKKAALRAGLNILASSPTSQNQSCDIFTPFASWTPKAKQEATLPPEVISLLLSPQKPEQIRLEKKPIKKSL